MFQCDPITTADVVLLVTTIILAGAAFLAPYLVSRIREEEKAPKLVASYDHKEPMARRSSRTIGGRPAGWDVYDFHFLVKNEGESKAEKTAAIIVEYRKDDGSGKLVKREDFLPVPLRYTTEDNKDIEFVDVHPNRPYYWNIGYVYPKKQQKSWFTEYLYDEPLDEVEGLLFRLDLYRPPYYQAQVLPKGTYGIKVVIYSENAKPAEILLKIEWSGTWAKEDQMFDEIKITQVGSFD